MHDLDIDFNLRPCNHMDHLRSINQHKMTLTDKCRVYNANTSGLARLLSVNEVMRLVANERCQEQLVGSLLLSGITFIMHET
jgi:hypothetical protein